MRAVVVAALVAILVFNFGCAAGRSGSRVSGTSQGNVAESGTGVSIDSGVLAERPDGYPEDVPFVPGGRIFKMSDTFEKSEPAQKMKHLSLIYFVSPEKLADELESRVDEKWEVLKERDRIFGNMVVNRITLSTDSRFVQLSIIPYGKASVLLVIIGSYVYK